MRYLLIAFLVFTSSAQAQIFDRDDGDGDGWRRHRRVYGGWREYRRHRVRYYRHHRRHYEGDEDRGGRHRERLEGYFGWWHPEGYAARGWREFEREGPRRCRPPMHAAGDADARRETARNLAIKSWQEQVINEHGERFLNYDAAFVIDEHCDPARVGEANIIELKRCVVTAAPCLKLREEDRERREEDTREEGRR
jgi:hypothetical protein